jgi:recombination protein RecR
LEYGSKILGNLIEAFSRLPGIGEKSAQRIALFLLKEGCEVGERLSQAILDLKEKIGTCSICFNITEEDPCRLCTDPKRNSNEICVVDEPKDLLAIERTGGYKGLYHVLGGVLSPLDGVEEGDLRIQELLDRVTPDIKEVIIATNPTVEGEMTAARLTDLLESKNVRVSRIARGIPFGGALEFNDAVTVAKAIEGRVEVKK